jgi:hypothetical protein
MSSLTAVRTAMATTLKNASRRALHDPLPDRCRSR